MQTLLDLLADLPVELIVVIVAALPLVELRGAIPVGLLLGLPPWETFLLAMAGNLIPVPLLLLLLGPLRRTATRWPVIGPVLRWAEARALKRREPIEKHGFWGLLTFVGIPLPGTGAWTGAFIAVLLDMPFRRAFTAIALGVLMAGILIAVLSTAGLMALQ